VIFCANSVLVMEKLRLMWKKTKKSLWTHSKQAKYAIKLILETQNNKDNNITEKWMLSKVITLRSPLRKILFFRPLFGLNIEILRKGDLNVMTLDSIHFFVIMFSMLFWVASINFIANNACFEWVRNDFWVFYHCSINISVTIKI
jgi:hypothetical protein